MAEIEQTREKWGSKVGFVLAAAGSAIGLAKTAPTVMARFSGDNNRDWKDLMV